MGRDYSVCVVVGGGHLASKSPDRPHCKDQRRFETRTP